MVNECSRLWKWCNYKVLICHCLSSICLFLCPFVCLRDKVLNICKNGSGTDIDDREVIVFENWWVKKDAAVEVKKIFISHSRIVIKSYALIIQLKHNFLHKLSWSTHYDFVSLWTDFLVYIYIYIWVCFRNTKCTYYMLHLRRLPNWVNTLDIDARVRFTSCRDIDLWFSSSWSFTCIITR